MDTTPRRVQARVTITDEERSRLMAEGKCFRCKQKGHMSQACPQKAHESGLKAYTTNQEEGATINTTDTTKLTPKELFDAITSLNDENKDQLIQEAFMGKDF